MAKKQSKRSKSNETTITLKLPKGIIALIRGLATMEGTSEDYWYRELLVQQLQSLIESPEFLLDFDKIIAHQHLEGILTPPT